MESDKLYILCIEEKVTKKEKNRMDTIFMNSKNSKTFDSYRLLLKPTDKVNLNRSDKHVDLSNHTI